MTAPPFPQLLPPTLPTPRSFDNGQAGVLAPSARGWFYSTFQLTAQQARWARFVLPRDMLITLLSFGVTTAATANDNIDGAIYDASLTTLLASSGPTAGKLNAGSNLVQNLSLGNGVVLRANTVYHAALIPGTVGGTAATLLAASFGSAIAQSLFGTNAGIMEGGFQNGAGTSAPASLSNAGGPVTAVPAIAVRES